MARQLPFRAAFAVFAVLLAPMTSLPSAANAGDCCRIEMEHVVFEAFEEDGKYGFRMQGGSFILIEPRYQFATDFTADGIAAVVDEEGWAWIDRSSAVRARPHVVDNGPDYFSEGFTRIVQDGKYGFMNARGDVVIAPQFAYAEPFSGGYALVCGDCRISKAGKHTSMTGHKWGLINDVGAIALRLEHSRDLARSAAATIP